MEIFQKAQTVRLRSHHDKYLMADDDQETVIQDRDGHAKNARWTVEFVENNGIRLKSIYGKYLTASNMPFLLRMTGKKVLQTVPKRLNSSIEWEPTREGVQVRLMTRYGQYLRANGGLPPWRNSVTHDIPHRTTTQDWVLWDVDILEFKPKPKPKPSRPPKLETPPPPMLERLESESSSPMAISLRSPSSVIRRELSGTPIASPGTPNEGRIIHYEVVDENGDIDEATGQRSSTFKGKGVLELKDLLLEETKLDDILVCSRNPLNGKLYPLRLHLPPTSVTMHIVVVPSSSKAAKELGL